MDKKMKLKQIAITILLCVVLFSSLSIPANAQGHPMGVAGYIREKTGIPADNADIMIINTDTGETIYTTTNVAGLYAKAITAENGDRISVTASKENRNGIGYVAANISRLTQWCNITIEKGSGDGGTAEETEQDMPIENIVEIPEPKPPEYIQGYTVGEMFDLLKITSLPKSDAKIIVLVIDSGITPRTFTARDNITIDLNKIQVRYNPAFSNGWDEFGHGTFVNYEIAYLLQTKMPNAVQISYKMFGEGRQTTAQIFKESLDEIKKIKPDIVSISAGTAGNVNDAFSKIVDECKRMGIIVIVSAGNYGPKPKSILSPGVSESAIAIGSFDFRQTSIFDDDIISVWSSRGPITGAEMKPDVAAPGESIIGPWGNTDTIKSGTSMSCPIISAGTALVWANNKGQIDIVKTIFFWDNGVIVQAYEEALKESCITKGNRNDWGAGIPQFDKVNEIFANKLQILMIEGILIIIGIIALIIGVIIFIKKRRSKKF